jgi:uncharacterized protein (DUF302 family)
MVIWTLVCIWFVYVPPVVQARDTSARMSHDTNKPFQVFTRDLMVAIRKNGMGLVCRANAQAGAASRGVKIAGNQVFMIYRPDFAIRMLTADLEAGFEAPLRIYVVEKPDGTARVSYIKPSDVFAGYNNRQLDAMARELDAIFAAIIRDAMQ